jgi:hypothetical protein
MTQAIELTGHFWCSLRLSTLCSNAVSGVPLRSSGVVTIRIVARSAASVTWAKPQTSSGLEATASCAALPPARRFR